MNIWPFTRTSPVEAKSLADPNADLLALFGINPSEAGISITEEAALRVPAVGSAVRVISEAVACLDVTIKQVAEDGLETDDLSHPVLGLLRNEANDWTSSYEMIRNLVSEALCTDTGGLAWVNHTGGGPREIIQYRRGVINVSYDQATNEPTYRVNNDVVPSQNIIHLRSPFGRAPLTLAREAIGVAAVLERHAARLFGRGARPSGVLKFPKGMGEDAVKRARIGWRTTHEGDDSGGRTAILYEGTEFEPLTMASTDGQFLENRKFQIEEIARAFRVPPSMLFHLDRATWSNTEQMGREFLLYCLEPWLRALEGALRRALFQPEDRGRYAVRFDRDDLTRADLSTRATVINSLISAKVINANEGRDWLGLGPYAGGDVFINPNITPEVPNGSD